MRDKATLLRPRFIRYQDKAYADHPPMSSPSCVSAPAIPSALGGRCRGAGSAACGCSGWTTRSAPSRATSPAARGPAGPEASPRRSASCNGRPAAALAPPRRPYLPLHLTPVRKPCTSPTRQPPAGDRRGTHGRSRPNPHTAKSYPTLAPFGDTPNVPAGTSRPQNSRLAGPNTMPPVGIEPTTFGLKDAHMQGNCRRYGRLRAVSAG